MKQKKERLHQASARTKNGTGGNHTVTVSGAAIPGAATSGVAIPGAATSGAAIPGAAIPGAATSGAATSDATTSDTSASGTAIPGATTSDATTSDTSASGTAIPGATTSDATTSDTSASGAATSGTVASLKILYRDAYLLVAEKPIGILSEKSADGGDMISLLEKETGRQIGSVHRLDRTTGGAMLFSCDPRVTGKLSEAIAAHDGTFEKEYFAIAEGIPSPAAGRMEDLLFHDRSRNKVFAVSRARKGAKQAVLDYRVLDSRVNDKGFPLSLCLVTLRTGRTHQIRAQFASRRCPLAGDGKYGGRDNRSPAAALWSYRLSFAHPVTGKRVEVFSFPPEGRYPWNLWGDLQARIRGEMQKGDISEGAEKARE